MFPPTAYTSLPKYVQRRTTKAITNVAIMIHTGVPSPRNLPKPMPSRKGDVMYVVCVSDQMLTMPR